MEKVKKLFSQKRVIEANYAEVQRQMKDKSHRHKNDIHSLSIQYEQQLRLIENCMHILLEDEAYVIQQHLIDGVKWKKIKDDYDAKWGLQYGKSERTLKSYQRNALQKICDFLEKQQQTTGVDYSDLLN